MKTVINKIAFIYILAFGLSSAVSFAEPKGDSALSDLPGRPAEGVRRAVRTGVADISKEADARFLEMAKTVFKKDYAQIGKYQELVKKSQAKVDELKKKIRDLELKNHTDDEGFNRNVYGIYTKRDALEAAKFLGDKEKYHALKDKLSTADMDLSSAKFRLEDAREVFKRRSATLREKGIAALEGDLYTSPIYDGQSPKVRLSQEGKSAYREFAAWLEGRPALRKLARWGGILGVGAVAAEAATAAAQAATAPVSPVELSVPDSPEHGGPTGEAGGEAPVY